MTAPFTPGPWHYLDMGEVVPSDSDGLPDPDTRICFMATPGSAINAFERIEANANLIASAPELYEALRDAANILQNLATRVTDHGSSSELRAKQKVLQEQADAAFAALAKAGGGL